MATDPNQDASRNALWTQLWNKQQLLYDFLQALNAVVPPNERPNYAHEIGNARYEIERIGAILDQLENGAPLPFPDPQQINEIRLSVGRLHQAVTNSAEADELIAAATAVIKSWPLSTGG